MQDCICNQIPVLKGLRQQGHEFKASLVHTARPCLKKNKTRTWKDAWGHEFNSQYFQKKKKKRANQPKQTTTKTKATEIRGVRRKTECVHAPPALEEDSHSWAWREKMSTVSE
jgi:hypothetical protein